MRGSMASPTSAKSSIRSDMPSRTPAGLPGSRKQSTILYRATVAVERDGDKGADYPLRVLAAAMAKVKYQGLDLSKVA